MSRLAGKAMKTCLDSDLLSAIAQARDPKAFTEFFNRYQKQAYNLAYHITHKSDLAEEALQECMLSIWTGAATFRGEGSARSWMLRIVANKCFGLLRKRKNQEVCSEDTDEDGVYFSNSSGEEQIVEGEATDALRHAIGNLGLKDRCMIAMYYTGEMSQEQIAQKFSMPTRTVSYRIQKALDVLRAQMAKAGYAAGTGMLAGKNIVEALCQGPGLPQKVTARILEQTLQTPPFSGFQTTHLHRSKLGSSSKIFLGVGLAGIMALGAWSILNPPSTPPFKPAQPSQSTADRQPSALPSNAEDEANDRGFHEKWTFENGAPTDLVAPPQYSWKWVPPRRDMRAGMVPADKSVSLQLPKQIYPRPFLLTLKARVLGVGEWGVQVLFVRNGKALPPTRNWQRFLQRNVTRKSIQKEATICLAFTGSHIFHSLDGDVFTLEEFAAPVPPSRVYLGFKNFRVEEIEIQTHQPDALGAAFQHPAECISKLKLKRAVWKCFEGGNIEWMTENH